MSEETLNLHHGKHHQTYITNLNKFIEGSDMSQMTLEEIIIQSSKDKLKSGIFNNASHHWNHMMFWKCMKPRGGGSMPKKLNDRMFITYFDIDNMTEVIVSTYNSNSDFKEAILKSTFIPFFMNGNPSYKGSIDGMNPYIFNRRTSDDNKILFIRLTQYGMLKKMIHSRGEKNGAQRISEGILDAHVFYTTNKSTVLCSWINYWSYLDYFKFRLRQFTRIILVCCIFLYIKIKPYIPKKIFRNKYIRLIRFLLYQLFDDLFIIFYNS